MKHFSRALITIICASVFAGCTSMPANYTVNNSRTYDQSYDVVWEKIVSFFASRNIPIKNIAKDSGVIYAESSSFDDTFADCGKGGIMAPFARRASFNVFVTRTGSKPKVSINTEFKESRSFQSSVTTVTCNSKGVTEQAVLDAIN